MFKNINLTKVCYIFLILAIFFIALFSAWKINPIFAPDELFRFTIPSYIYHTNTLPVGSEIQIRDPRWGYSYGFLPYLPSLISVIFMKIANLFGSFDLIKTSRLVSVFAIVGTSFVTFKIGKELFDKKSLIFLFVVLCIFLPQFVFLGSYLNNDCFAVFMSSIIIYCWIKGILNNWPTKTCILLGISVGALALTYYNAYAFILCTIFIYCGTFLKMNEKNWNSFIKKGLIIFLIAFAIAGWFFIRNYLNTGDFLGLSITEKYGQLYAVDAFKPQNRLTPLTQNVSFIDAFFKPYIVSSNWFVSSWKSFIGCFGYMNIAMNKVVYWIYTILIGFGLLFSLGYIKNTFLKKEFNIKLFIISLIICIILPILLSMDHSYTTDFQPQGRYWMSMLIPFMIFVSLGFMHFVDSNLFKRLLSAFKKQSSKLSNLLNSNGVINNKIISNSKLRFIKDNLDFYHVITGIYLLMFVYVFIKYFSIMFH